METIPIVNLDKFLDEGLISQDTWARTGKEVGRALHDYGFVYLENHGIDKNEIGNCFRASKAFFEQPMEQKLLYKYEYKSPKGYHGQGYSIKDGESIFGVRESINFTGKIRKHPDDKFEYYDQIQEFQVQCIPLVKKLFKLIAIGLGLEDWDFFLKRATWMDNMEVPSFKTFRSLYYPAIPERITIPDGVLRVKEHSDFDFITLLFQDSIGGLEIKARSGNWIPAAPIPGTVIVNIGDLLESWTGGYFPATKHRVIIPELENKKRIARQSIAYFLHPDSNTLVTPLDSPCLVGSKTFDGFKAYEHTKAKLASVQSY